MDNAPSHVSAQVTTALAAANCMVIFLPPKTSAHLQPLDVGVNGPFKNACKSLWSDWMIALGDHKPTPKEDRVALSIRIESAFSSIASQSIRNAFSKCGL